MGGGGRGGEEEEGGPDVKLIEVAGRNKVDRRLVIDSCAR